MDSKHWKVKYFKDEYLSYILFFKMQVKNIGTNLVSPMYPASLDTY